LPTLAGVRAYLAFSYGLCTILFRIGNRNRQSNPARLSRKPSLGSGASMFEVRPRKAIPLLLTPVTIRPMTGGTAWRGSITRKDRWHCRGPWTNSANRWLHLKIRLTRVHRD